MDGWSLGGYAIHRQSGLPVSESEPPRGEDVEDNRRCGIQRSSTCWFETSLKSQGWQAWGA